MNSKGHFYISISKSLLRIIACLLFIYIPLGLNIGLWLFLIAELLGIAEEVFDKR